MKMTFKEMVSGEEYQKHATDFCKALIFLSVITSIINYIFSVDVGIFFIIIFLTNINLGQSFYLLNLNLSIQQLYYFLMKFLK